MTLLATYRQKELSPGVYPYLRENDETGLSFDLLVMAEGAHKTIESKNKETALVVIKGDGSVSLHKEMIKFSRQNWLEQNPWVVHFPSHESIEVKADSNCKLAIIQTPNPLSFPPQIYSPQDIDVEHRGKGLLDDTCYRHVRLAFDRKNAPKEAKLVIGEVLNYPGKWSSYPPHHHPQSELYYYEFFPREGYGHGELGEDVHKIKHQDLLKITDNRDHSQVSAPGYHLYYIWAIKHDPENPYEGFEFTKPYDRVLKS